MTRENWGAGGDRMIFSGGFWAYLGLRMILLSPIRCLMRVWSSVGVLGEVVFIRAVLLKLALTKTRLERNSSWVFNILNRAFWVE